MGNLRYMERSQLASRDLKEWVGWGINNMMGKGIPMSDYSRSKKLCLGVQYS